MLVLFNPWGNFPPSGPSVKGGIVLIVNDYYSIITKPPEKKQGFKRGGPPKITGGG